MTRLTDIKQYFLIAILVGALGIIPFVSGGFDTNFTLWISMICAVLLIVVLFTGKNNLGVSFKSPFIYLLIFVLFSAVSVFWSINPFRTSFEVILFVFYLVVFVSAYLLSHEKELIVLKVVTLTAALTALLGLFQYLLIYNGRIESTFGTPTVFAAFMAMFFLIVFSYYIRTKMKWGGLLSVIFLATLILTSSRGAFIAVLLAFPITFIGIKRDEWKGVAKTTLVILGSTAVFTLLCIFIAPLIQKGGGIDADPLGEIIRVSSVSRSTSGRFEFWKVAWDLLWQKPLLGFGQGTFFEAYNISHAGNQWFSRFAHNQYLQIAVETGLLGLGLFTGFLMTSLFGIIKGFRKIIGIPYLPGIVAACIAFLAHIFLDISFNYPAVALLFFALAGIVASHIEAGGKQRSGVIFKYVTAAVLVISIVVGVFLIGSVRVLDRGLRLSSYGNSDKAITTIEKGIKLFPLNNQGYSILGGAYLKRYQLESNPDDIDSAIANMVRATEIAQYNANHYLDLGRMYIIAGQFENAVASYKKAIIRSPLSLGGYIELAVIYAGSGEVDKAFEWLKTAEEKTPFAIENAIRFNQENLETIRYNAATVYTYLATIYDDYDDPDTADAYRKKSDEVLNP